MHLYYFDRAVKNYIDIPDGIEELVNKDYALLSNTEVDIIDDWLHEQIMIEDNEPEWLRLQNQRSLEEDTMYDLRNN